MALGLFLLAAMPVRAADPEIDRLLQAPIGKDWVTNGGNMTNERYSTLKQIDTTNVKQLKGAWMTRLKGSGLGGKYSFEATPLVKDGIMYISTGNDDVFALNAKTGEILWEHWSGIGQTISTVCCGWLNRGLAMGEGMLFIGQLDANVVALDIKTGKEVWRTPVEDWHNGYGITNAPLYFDGIVYSGITGGEFGIRGRLTALDAKTGKILWRAYTLPGPGEVGSDTWPAGTDQAMRGGASIWNTPALDPELGLVYFAVGNCGPDYDGSVREGDNLFCASVLAVNAKTGAYAWHFQEVHHDIWDYDAASPVVLFDTTINGQPRKGIAQAARTGLGLHPRPHQRQTADRRRGARGAPGAAAEDGEDAALPARRRDRAAMRRAHGCERLRKGRLHLRGVLGRAGIDPALGDRRHQLGTDVVQSRNR
jgi:PQQ-dependent dehydrogenase (methanol/ethanol family)